MIIDLKQLLKSKECKTEIDYSFSIKDEEIDGIKPFVSDVKAKGELRPYAGSLELQVELSYDFLMPCSRCMEETLSHKTLSVRHALVKEDCENDDDFYIQVENIVDLDELFFQEIILNLPIVYICKDDCRGICPKCGVNLNNKNCSCETGEVKTAFSGLKALLEN